MELVVVNHEEHGLEEQKAKQISALFTPMLKTMEELEVEKNEILKLPMNEETYAKARDLRLRYKKTRTGTAEIHKRAKAQSLSIGNFLDSWKRTQALAAGGAEDQLTEIEKHEELEKQRKIDGLQVKRTKALKKYELEVVPDNLGELDTVSWNNYLTGTKVNFEKRKEEEQKAEDSRLETERIAGLRAVRRAETVKYSDFIPEYKSLDLGDIKDEVYHELLQQAKDKFDAKVKQDELDKEELERLQKKSKEDKEEKDRLQKIIDDKDVEDKRLEKEKSDKLQGELNASDATKVASLINDLSFLASKYTFKSKKNQKMYTDVIVLLGKVITYIKK